MATTDENTSRGRTRRQLIEQAQLECSEYRAVCDRYNTHNGDIPRQHRIEFQNAIVDYYWALRPLRNQKRVEELWQDAVLSKSWTVRNGDGEDVPVTGLDSIQYLNRMTEKVSEVKHTVRGTRVETDRQLQVLPFPVLADIYATLEDAAAELGFTVEPGVTVEEDPAPV